MSNPFHDSLDQFRGRRVRATGTNGQTLVGWVERIHHHDRHVVLRDATDPVTGESVGRAMLAHVDQLTLAEDDQERIERVPVDDVHPAPWSAGDWDAYDNRYYIRRVRGDGWVGSYPVVRPVGNGNLEVVEGHKRLWVCEQAGLDEHPVAIVDLDDWQAVERFVADHFPAESADSRSDGVYDDEQLRASIEHLVGVFGADIRDHALVDHHMDRLDLAVQGLSVREVPDSGGDWDGGEADVDVETPAETEGSEAETEAEASQANGGGPDVSADETAGRDDQVLPEFEDLAEDDTDQEDVDVDVFSELTDAGDPFHGEQDRSVATETDAGGEAVDESSVEDVVEIVEDYGTYTARDYGIALAGVQEHFDADRVTVVSQDYGADLVPGGERDGPDYSVSENHIQLGNPGRKAVGADPGDDVRAIPDGEAIRLELVDEADDTGEADSPEPAADNADDTNPYEPDDLGTLSVRHQDHNDRVALNVPRRVVREFDSDHIHIRKRDGRVEMAPGGHDDWPDYAARQSTVLSNRRVIRDLLDVVAGDEVRAVPDGDVVVLEPNRCAERDRFVDCGTGEARQYGRQKVLSLPIGGERFLDDPDHVHVRETDSGYTVHAGEHGDWPSYAQVDGNSGLRLGAQALDLLSVDMGEEVRARGDRERGVIELAPPGQDFADPDESADGNGARWRDYNGEVAPDDECENCGADLVNGYAAVFEPEDGDSVRCCPNCEDKIRERDGTVRPKRNVAGGGDD